MKPGYILEDFKNNKTLGVIVYVLPTKVFLFRLDKNDKPTFSKLSKNELHEGVSLNGNINQNQHEKLKHYLLRHYRSKDLTSTEKKMLQPLMNFSFPNGIPHYDSSNLQQSSSLENLKLKEKLNKGSCLYINTSPYTKFNHLDNKKVYVMKPTELGIWICTHEDRTQPIFSYLPYKDKNGPTFYGISKVIPNEKSNEHFMKYDSIFKELEDNNSLYSMIMHDDNRMKIDPTDDNKIIFPHKYQGSCYDFKTDRVIKPSEAQILAKEDAILSKGNMDKVDNTLFDNELDYAFLQELEDKRKSELDSNNSYSSNSDSNNSYIHIH